MANATVLVVDDESLIRWPGNIRELRNAIERAMLLIDRDQVRYRIEKLGLHRHEEVPAVQAAGRE